MAYFTSNQMAEGIWAIHGPVNDLMYLVTGTQRAMLIDTGMGIGDLAREVKKLTDLPLTVVNTHGHPDHAGGNYNFKEVWLPEKDLTIMRTMCSDDFRLSDLKAILGENHPDIQFLLNGMVHSRSYQIRFIQPGQVFDLGEQCFKVVEIPGHTPGSIGLLNSAEKILFSGDTIVATPVWLYLKHSLPVKTYQQSLMKIKEREGEFRTIFPGHPPTPLGIDQLDDLIECAGEILNGSGVGEPTRTFAGEGLLWVHGKAQIIYDPKKIYEE